jgi:hypothetical protein
LPVMTIPWAMAAMFLMTDMHFYYSGIGKQRRWSFVVSRWRTHANHEFPNDLQLATNDLLSQVATKDGWTFEDVEIFC